jgi:UDP:flavonoid glycosyltransferase YjiC (YdhE family)
MRILLYTSPARGHLYPTVPIMYELRRRGHELTLRTLASQVQTMRSLGFDAKPISSSVEEVELDDFKARSRLAKGRRTVATFAARAEREVPDLRAAIDQERPEALLVDCMTWGAAAVAEAAGGPWAQFLPYPLPLPSCDAPPFGMGLTPAAGPLGALRDLALNPLAGLVLDRMLLPDMNALRATLGVPALNHGADVFAHAPLVLHLTAEPFEYPRRDRPASVLMVGPCAWEPPSDPPDWLAAVKRPLILVSTSSERQADRRLVITAFEALAGEDLELVATLPAEGIGGIEVPANAHAERFLAHGPLLARAACAITHGGAGVTQKALAAGVPVCVVPFGRDQDEVARRVEVAGAGTRLPAARLSPERLRDKVAAAMRMRSGSRKVAEAFAAAGGPVAAADAIENLARRHSRGARNTFSVVL